MRRGEGKRDERGGGGERGGEEGVGRRGRRDGSPFLFIDRKLSSDQEDTPIKK